MPRTQSISTSSGMSFPPSPVSETASPKTPIRSRLGISGLPTPFSGKKTSSKASPITKSTSSSDDVSMPSTPLKSAFPSSITSPMKKSRSSAEDAYPSPSKEKDTKHSRASSIVRAPSLHRSSSSTSSKDKENHTLSVASRARAKIASVLSKPSITTSFAAHQAQLEREDLHLSLAGEDLVDTLRAIRARSASTASVDSVATVRASLNLERPVQSKKRERTDSMVSVCTTRAESVAPSRKRERLDSTASVDSVASVREIKPLASSNGKRQRLHSNIGGTEAKGGASAAALAARAAVAASRAQELKKKTESEEEDEEEVLRMLFAPGTHNNDMKKSNQSPLDLLRNRTKQGPGPLLRKESTCALITPALASARLDLKPRPDNELPEITSQPSSPVNHGRSLSDEMQEVDASFFSMDDRPARSSSRHNPAGEGYALSLSLSDTAFWDITPSSTVPLVAQGTLVLSDPNPSYAYPPDVALDISCTVAPVQRGLGRLNRPVERETPVDVVVDREWERVREGWSAPVELRIPPSLFSGAESRMISLLLEGNLLLPRGRGDVEIEAQAQISVSALRSNREMALSEAERARMEAIQKEKEEIERRYAEWVGSERERLMGMKYEEMSEEERLAFREWMDAQEDVL